MGSEPAVVVHSGGLRGTILVLAADEVRPLGRDVLRELGDEVEHGEELEIASASGCRPFGAPGCCADLAVLRPSMASGCDWSPGV